MDRYVTEISTLVAVDEFQPHRIQVPLDVKRSRRSGPVAIGRVFEADLAFAELRFY
jgi:hypothetical protein